MKYRLLDNGNGVIVSRRPALLTRSVEMEFSGAPDGSKVILETESGMFLYRDISGERCEVQLSKLKGVVKVTLVTAPGEERRKWVCEELFVDHLDEEHALVCPNDMNLPQVVTDLRIENEALRRDQAELRKQIEALDGRLERMMEGYDIT